MRRIHRAVLVSTLALSAIGRAEEAPLPAAAPAPEPTGPPPPLMDVQVPSRKGERTPPPPLPQWNADTPMMMEPPPPPPASEPDRDPVLGLNLGLGVAFGGDELGEAEFDDGTRGTLGAGNGVVISVGVMFTPIWLAGKLGLGIGGDAGWKYTSLSGQNGILSLDRFPLVASAHVLYEVSPRWYLMASGGPSYEAGISITGDGVFDGIHGRPDGDVGWMAEVGAFYAKRELGADITLRYTAARFEESGDPVDASSVGLFGAFHYHLL